MYDPSHEQHPTATRHHDSEAELWRDHCASTIQSGAVLGTEAFVEWAREELQARAPDAEVARLAIARPQPSLEDISRAVAASCGVNVAELRHKGRKRQAGRDVAIHLARELSGCSLKEIGSHFGGIRPPGVSMAHGRVAESMRSNCSLRERVAQLSQGLTDADE